MPMGRTLLVAVALGYITAYLDEWGMGWTEACVVWCLANWGVPSDERPIWHGQSPFAITQNMVGGRANFGENKPDQSSLSVFRALALHQLNAIPKRIDHMKALVACQRHIATHTVACLTTALGQHC